MKAHTGLPKNIPKNPRKAIITSSPSPTHRFTQSSLSPTPKYLKTQDSNQKSAISTVRKQSRKCKSPHHIKSKSKPKVSLDSTSSFVKQFSPTSYKLGEQKKWIKKYQPQRKEKKSQFIEQALWLMSGLIENKFSEEKRALSSSKQFSHQFGLSNLQMERQLKNQNNQWNKYFGGACTGKNEEGFCVIYFKNGDKFLGNFKKGRANGHGTYHQSSTGKKFMGIWENNKITMHSASIIINQGQDQILRHYKNTQI